jgi:hypothetical protein
MVAEAMPLPPALEQFKVKLLEFPDKLEAKPPLVPPAGAAGEPSRTQEVALVGSHFSVYAPSTKIMQEVEPSVQPQVLMK